MINQQGLTLKEVKELQNQYGFNRINNKNKNKLIYMLKNILKEPIYVLLLSASIIYFILGEQINGIIMIAFVNFVIALDIIQDIRTGNTLRRLKDISTPKVKVIREGQEMYIDSIEIVPGDLMIISEGEKIQADGRLIYVNGLYVDESILTGESEGIWKTADKSTVSYIQPSNNDRFNRLDYCYAGTHIILGNGIMLVELTGNNTQYGKIAEGIMKADVNISPLQKQMSKLARQCTYIAGILLIAVTIATFFNSNNYSLQKRIIESFLAGVVLALSMVPGEFPVLQSVFLTMGALRLAKKKALVKSLSAVETLGGVSVICMDKTGTITRNQMSVLEFWAIKNRYDLLCRAVTLSCKENTYDPMEKAMLNYCGKRYQEKEEDYVSACILSTKHREFLKEFAFTNELRAMGQIWKVEDSIIICAKGCTETILPLCNFTKEEEEALNKKIIKMSEKGLRVIAVAERIQDLDSKLPDSLLECRFCFRGVIGLSDPPRDGIKKQLNSCYRAGIRIIMITGDHPLTAVAIGKSVGIKKYYNYITGDMISTMSDSQLCEIVNKYNIYARVLPLHKMRIVKALKDNGIIAAMIGDGVNDSPALKIADIGVAMGRRGCEIIRETADLVLLDDNFNTIIDSIKDGRRIYNNITKAVGYIFAIHIPIALISLLAPMLGISPGALMLLPIHIVLLELVMDPTCSIAIERLPEEDNIMLKPPRSTNKALLSSDLLIKSILQGCMVFLASFFLYLFLLYKQYPVEIARTAGYGVLVLSNILLVIENCSESEGIIKIIKKLKRERGVWLVNIITLIEFIIMVYTPLSSFLHFRALSLSLLIITAALSGLSVLWFELIKVLIRRNRHKNNLH